MSHSWGIDWAWRRLFSSTRCSQSVRSAICEEVDEMQTRQHGKRCFQVGVGEIE